MSGAKTASVLFITHGPLMYGAQRSLLSLLRGVDRERINPILLSPRPGPLTLAVEQIGIPFVCSAIEHWVLFGQVLAENRIDRINRFGRTVLGLRGRAAAIAKIAKNRRVDAIYTNTVTVLEGAVAARMLGIPHIWHLREHVAGNRDLKALFPPSIVSYVVNLLSERVIVNSNALIAAYGGSIARNKIEVVYNGIDLNMVTRREQSSAHQFKTQLGMPENANIIGVIGSITKRKNHGMFIRVASEMIANAGPIYFVVIGDGDPVLVASLKREVLAKGLDERFRFIGWRDDVSEIIPCLDVLLVTSEQEAFGRTVIEAMAAGVPVVSTKCGGPEEIIVPGETGILVPVDDDSAMASAAREILSDGAFAGRLTSAAAERVRATFGLSAYVEKLQSIILQAADPFGTATSHTA